MKRVKDSYGFEYDVLAELGLVSCVKRIPEGKSTFGITWLENDRLTPVEVCDKCGHIIEVFSSDK